MTDEPLKTLKDHHVERVLVIPPGRTPLETDRLPFELGKISLVDELRAEAILYVKKNGWLKGKSITVYDWLDFFNLEENDIK